MLQARTKMKKRESEKERGRERERGRETKKKKKSRLGVERCRGSTGVNVGVRRLGTKF